MEKMEGWKERRRDMDGEMKEDPRHACREWDTSKRKRKVLNNNDDDDSKESIWKNAVTR